MPSWGCKLEGPFFVGILVIGAPLFGVYIRAPNPIPGHPKKCTKQWPKAYEQSPKASCCTVWKLNMGGCQNHGPRCRIIIRTQKGTIILTTTHRQDE